MAGMITQIGDKDILDRFIREAKATLAEGSYDVAEADADVTLPKFPKCSLKEKLLKNNFTLICEIKHASPAGEYSFGNIDVQKTADEFKLSGADAISVVVEPKIFKGSLSNIPVAKSTGLPVLMKDFVIDERQIRASKAMGADVILLVVKVTNRLGLDLDRLIEVAHSCGLEVLLESYDAEEMRIAIESDADILGINNRDLRTLTVNLNRTKEILDAFESVPKPVISESGVKNAVDIAMVKNTGVNGVLVGTAIWKATSLKEKIRELKSGGQDG